MKHAYASREKQESRQYLLDTYKQLTGNATLPEGKQYWTLCNSQPRTNSELSFLTDTNFLKPQQFHGVDSNQNIIKQNGEIWPRAHWYTNEWRRAVMEVDNFNPGLVFYDSTNTPDSPRMYENLLYTLRRSPPKTFVCVNLMLKNTYSGESYPESRFLDSLADKLARPSLVGEYKRWNLDSVEFCRYKQGSKRTEMGMYCWVGF